MQNTFNRATTSVTFVYANTAKCRSSRPELFLEISQISQENTCASLFLIKLQAWGLQL